MQTKIDEIARQISEARRAIDGMKTAIQRDDMRREWETFLTRFSRAINKLVDTAKLDERTRKLGDDLLTASLSGDPSLKYLRAARNVDDHGIELPAADYGKASANLGKAVTVDEGASLTISNFMANGQNLGSVAIISDNNGFSASGDLADAVEFKPASVKLKNATYKHKRKTIDVAPPTSAVGKSEEPFTALDLAETALKGLETKFDDFQQLLK